MYFFTKNFQHHKKNLPKIVSNQRNLAQNVNPSQAKPSQSGIVPICCTMLSFATFIGTRGLEHYWESHGTFLKVPPLQIFGTSACVAVGCCQFPYMLYYCTFGTFIDTLGLEHCWQSHGIFWKNPSKSWHKCRHCSRSPLAQICCIMLPFSTFRENQRPGRDPKSVFFSDFFF